MSRDGTTFGHGLLVVNAERKRKHEGEESDGAHSSRTKEEAWAKPKIICFIEIFEKEE